ncbi:hypothetical protein CIK06_02650 [Plantactinospora sp. KBS50]|nr:hypothetical protein CIK06_02650 [Plantactinospora sp. KBS50]
MSADERRIAVLKAARIEFGASGYAGTSTEAIARRVGVSQPYLFRLFPSKKAIFLAALEDCFDRLEELFETAGEGLSGAPAREAMGAAYAAQLEDRSMLQLQLQMWAVACDDADVRAVARRRMGRMWAQFDRIIGGDDREVMQFMASGMLLNVFAALDIPRIKEQLGESLTGLIEPPPEDRAG